MTNSLMHIALNASDIERSIDFYCRVLGGELVFSAEREGGGLQMAYVRIAPGQFIEIFRAEPAGDASPVPNGFAHFCLTVPDVYSEADRIRAAGYTIRVEPKAGRYGNLQIWLRDPDGVDIEIMQLLPDFLGGSAPDAK